ncbi:MAG TPA: PLP-dependent aminotransferase family protein, partial [Chloroflexota bacterium]|nr:PLP-dependent aminotransferase family protein [Chloroflexota bacterium]
PGVPFAPPEGGFFLGLTLPEGARTDGLLERAQASGLLLSDGRAFFAPLPGGAPGTGAPDGAPSDREAERFIRLPFCALTPEQIEEGVRRLGALVA